jgi:thioredoxin reductase
VVIGGGVAGYVAAIKAGQEGLKVTFSMTPNVPFKRARVLTVVAIAHRPFALRNAAPLEAHV